MMPSSYNLLRPWETLDPWQTKYINTTDKDCLVAAGRQVGKSAAAAIKIVNYISRKPNTTVLIGALTEKQAQNLYFRALLIADEMHKGKIDQHPQRKPTKNKFEFKHKEGNSRVLCHALGLTGEGIRGFTVDHLFIDECKEIAEIVFVAIEPMISVTKGTRDYLGTPGGKIGHFFACSKDEDFEQFRISAFDCPRHTKEDLEKYRSRMSKREFAQEYLGEFLDDVMRVFNDEIINRKCTISEVWKSGITKGKYKSYGGVDVARLGENKSAFSIGISLDAGGKRQYSQVHYESTEKELTTSTTKKILELQKEWQCKKWGIDGAGVGGGVVDQCRQLAELKWKVEDLQNAKKSTDSEGLKSARLLKEDMYINLLRMMENDEITLLENDEIIESLKNAYFEYDENGKMRVFGAKNDAREATIRMALLMAQDKSLNLWADYI